MCVLACLLTERIGYHKKTESISPCALCAKHLLHLSVCPRRHYSFTHLVVKDLGGSDAHCLLFEWIQPHFLDDIFVHICIRQAFIISEIFWVGGNLFCTLML